MTRLAKESCLKRDVFASGNVEAAGKKRHRSADSPLTSPTSSIRPESTTPIDPIYDPGSKPFRPQVQRLPAEVLLSIPLSTTFSPQFHHLRTTFYQSIFRSRCLPTTKDNHRQAESNLGTTENSPPFTTNPEDTFSPQQSGPSTAIDFAPVRNIPCGIQEGDGRASAKKKAPSSKGWGSRICRRSPNLPHTYACSTIGPTRLNFRVRDGNGCDPRGKLTGKVLKSRSRDLPQLNRLGVDVSTLASGI